LDAVQAAYEADTAGAELDEVLDAQRRLADAESNYYRALVEYASSIKNVHFEKGSLLDYNGIYLEEGPWPHKAYCDAARKADLRCRPWPFYGPLEHGTVVSSGPAPQLVLPQPGMGYHGDPSPLPGPSPPQKSGTENEAPPNPPAPKRTTNIGPPQYDTANARTDWEPLKPGPQTQVPTPFADQPPGQSSTEDPRLIEILPAPRN
jgi:hypothetical protein